MAETPNATTNAAAGAALSVVGKTLSLKWIRPLVYNLGGRKIAAGGGALYVISEIAKADIADWPKAIICLSAAVVAAAVSIGIGIEDGKKQEKPKA